MSENNCDLLKILAQHFYKCSLAFTLSPEDVATLSWEHQKKFLNMTVNSERLRRYPVNKKFCRLFFKKLIGFLQPSQDIQDDFFTFLCSVMSETEDQFSFRHYVIDDDLNNIITIRETNNMVVNGTTGLKTWEAAVMLTDWAICNKTLFENKRVIELGSGVGLTGISIAKLCSPKSMLLTDCHNEVLQTICRNIEINFPHLDKKENHRETLFSDKTTCVGVMPFDWNYIGELPSDLVPDVVIGADIVYDPSILQPLCKVFQTLFERNSYLEVYIESVIRNEETFEKFVDLLRNMSFNVEQLIQERPVFLQWDHNTNTSLLKITNC